MNPMKQIRIEKLTINVGSGTNNDKLEKGMKLIKNITGVEPVKTYTTKRIPTWSVRPGLSLGCKLTLRKQPAQELLKRLLQAKENKLKIRQFDSSGNVAFGIHEYIDIPDAKYDPDIGIMGFEVCVTLDRAGYRVKRRRTKKAPISKKHAITKEEAIEFFKQNYNVVVS